MRGQSSSRAEQQSSRAAAEQQQSRAAEQQSSSRGERERGASEETVRGVGASEGSSIIIVQKRTALTPSRDSSLERDRRNLLVGKPAVRPPSGCHGGLPLAARAARAAARAAARCVAGTAAAMAEV